MRFFHMPYKKPLVISIFLTVILVIGVVLAVLFSQQSHASPTSDGVSINLPTQTPTPTINGVSINLPAQTPISTIKSTRSIYVSPTGNDHNDGSQAHPFATIQKAARVVTPGTAVHVLPGTYTSITENTRSGTANAPITYISDTRWAAKIATGGALFDFPFRNDGSYVNIIGFDITSTSAWIGILTYGQHNLIEGNHVHNMTGMACNGTPGGEGIGDDESASHTFFLDNVVDHIGNYPTQCEFIQGIYPSGAGDVVQNNIAYDNVGAGIAVNHESGPMMISNNLVFANANPGIELNADQQVDGFIVNNNIVMHNGVSGIDVHSAANGSHNQYIDNILFQNTGGAFNVDGSPGTPQGTIRGTITADPQLVNYQANGSGDYHLQAGSPAIGAGTTTGAPSTDFDGKPRSQGTRPDIGPYAFDGAG